jgi:hypothetical protein
VILVDAGPAEELDGVTVLERATAIGLYEGNYVVAVQRGRRLWHPRAKRIVLATGAFERPEIFEHNDRPGVMLAGAAARYGVEEGVHPVSGAGAHGFICGARLGAGFTGTIGSARRCRSESCPASSASATPKGDAVTADLSEPILEAQVSVRGEPPPGFPVEPGSTAVVDGRTVLWLGPTSGSSSAGGKRTTRTLRPRSTSRRTGSSWSCRAKARPTCLRAAARSRSTPAAVPRHCSRGRR